MSRQSLLVVVGLLALAGCAAPAPPDYAAQYQPAVDAFMAGWNAGNVDGLNVGLAANFRRRASGGLNSDDLAAFKQLVTDFRTTYPDANVVRDERRYMMDQSFHLWTFTGTNTGPGATSPTEKSVKLTDSTRWIGRHSWGTR